MLLVWRLHCRQMEEVSFSKPSAAICFTFQLQVSYGYHFCCILSLFSLIWGLLKNFCKTGRTWTPSCLTCSCDRRYKDLSSMFPEVPHMALTRGWWAGWKWSWQMCYARIRSDCLRICSRMAFESTDGFTIKMVFIAKSPQSHGGRWQIRLWGYSCV